MTFSEIVVEIKDRLNLTSAEATARIGREVNARYRRVTSSVGLNDSRRITGVACPSTLASAHFTFQGIEKIERVYDTRGGNIRILGEVSFDELRSMTGTQNAPTHYAIEHSGAQFVQIRINCSTGDIFTLYADGLEVAQTLVDGQVPRFPESYHDLLVEGVVADELRKMEKLRDASAAESTFESRLSDLRLFLAKSAYLTRRQGSRATEKFGHGGAQSGGEGIKDSWTQQGLITFDRDPAPPFAVSDGSGPVENLVAEGAQGLVNVPTNRLVGRDQGGTGGSEFLSVTGGVEFTGSGGIRRSALTGDVTAPAGGVATTLAPGAVTTPKIADGAVTTPKIADGAVTTPKLGANSVTSAVLAPSAVQSGHIQDGAIQATDIATGAITTPKLADGAVTTPKLATNSVTSTVLAPNAVGSVHLQSGAVQATHIADGAIITREIADGAVTEPKLATNAVSTITIQDDAVTYDKIQDVSASSRLLGRRSTGGGGTVEEITLGTGLSMTGTVLNSAAGGVDFHAPTHAEGGSDPVDITGLAGFPGNTTTFLRADGTFAVAGIQSVPAHHASHEPGGADALVNVAWTNLANTFTARNTFTSRLTVTTSGGGGDNAARLILLDDVNSPPDARKWHTYSHNQNYTIIATSDNDAVAHAGMFTFYRSGDLEVANGGVVTKQVRNTAGTPAMRLAGGADGEVATGGVIDLVANLNPGSGGNVHIAPGNTAGSRVLFYRRDAAIPLVTIDGWTGDLQTSGTVSAGAVPAATGVLRIPNGQVFMARNAANTGDISLLSTDTGDNLWLGQVGVSTLFLPPPTVCNTLHANQYLSSGSATAQGGHVRMPNNTWLMWRNMSNTGDVGLIADQFGQLRMDGFNLFYPNVDNVADLGHPTFRFKIANLSQAIAVGTVPALSGHVRVPAGGSIVGRNPQNTADNNMMHAGGDNNLYIGWGGSGGQFSSVQFPLPVYFGEINCSVVANITGPLVVTGVTNISSYGERYQEPQPSGGTLVVNLAYGHHVGFYLSQNISSLVIQNIPSYAVSVTFRYYTEGVQRYITWPANTRWPNGVTPTPGAVAWKWDIVTLYTTNGGGEWFGFVNGQNM